MKLEYFEQLNKKEKTYHCQTILGTYKNAKSNNLQRSRIYIT